MIKKLMSYIGEYKRDTLLSPISVTFEVILEVLLPMLMAKVIDNGVEAGNMNYVAMVNPSPIPIPSKIDSIGPFLDA